MKREQYEQMIVLALISCLLVVIKGKTNVLVVCKKDGEEKVIRKEYRERRGKNLFDEKSKLYVFAVVSHIK